MKKIKLWWQIIRPKTLFASLCPVIAAGLLYFGDSHLHLADIFSSFSVRGLTFLITLLCAVCLQVLSNLINDYYDYKKGSDKKGRIGFKRALAEGVVSPEQMKVAIYVTLASALSTGLFLVIRGGLPILFIGITAILFAWLYTATRFSLSYLGIADIFCFLYYGIFAVAGTYCLLQSAEFNLLRLSFPLTKSVLCVGAVCGLISMTVLMINNLRDINDDRQACKRTLPVRFGKKTGEIALLVYSLLMLVLTFVAFGLSFTDIIFIPAYMLYSEVSSAQGEQYNRCLFKAGLMNLFFVFLLALEVLI